MVYYVITAPETPGARPTSEKVRGPLTRVRALAEELYGRRRDLRHQDVRIESPVTGDLVEYAGPGR
jgi:hypothetical protein